MATIKDIARLSGYSVGTVSRVINNHPDVSDEARDKIQQIIREQNYHPNINARLLKAQQQTSVAVLVKGQQNIFLQNLLERVQDNLTSSGEEVSVTIMDEADDEVFKAIELCRNMKPKGIIFLGGNGEFFREEFTDEIDVPCVLLTNNAKDFDIPNLSSYYTDDIVGGEAAVNYLIQRGHANIGIVGSHYNVEQGQIGNQRIQGAIHAMKAHGIAFDVDTQYAESRFSLESGYAAALDLYNRNPDLTAIFALSDVVAIGVLRAVADLGLRVPEDVSLIGYDGIAYTQYLVPRITTIRQDSERLARKAVDDLLLRINYNKRVLHQAISFQIIEGESVRDLEF